MTAPLATLFAIPEKAKDRLFKTGFADARKTALDR